MAQQSTIEWTDLTWNPVVGCSIESSGCTNCYAMRMAARLQAMGSPKYEGLTRKTKRGAVWTDKVRCDEASVEIPLTWKKPRRVFVNSMSDLFHADVPEAFADRAGLRVDLTDRCHHFRASAAVDLEPEGGNPPPLAIGIANAEVFKRRQDHDTVLSL